MQFAGVDLERDSSDESFIDLKVCDFTELPVWSKGPGRVVLALERSRIVIYGYVDGGV